MQNAAKGQKGDPFRDFSVEDIENAYRSGKITAHDRNLILQAKTRHTVAQTLAEDGYLKAILKRTIVNVQEGWDNVVEATKTLEDQPWTQGDDIKIVAKFFWGQLQMVTSVMNAFGEVTGQVAENLALKSGASPGLARVINVATDIGTGLVPVGTVTKIGVKLGHEAAEKGAKKVGKATAEEAAKAEHDAAMRSVMSIMEEGLKVEGVKVGKEAVEKGAKITDDVIEKVAPKIPVQESFSKDLATFRREANKMTDAQSVAEVKKLATKLGVHIDDLESLIPGKALDPKHVLSYFQALQPKVDDLISLAKQVQLDGTEAAANAFAKHATELFTLIPTSNKTDVIRKTPLMKNLTDMFAGWHPESVASGDFAQAIRTMADDVIAMADDPRKLLQFTAQTQAGFAENGHKVWAGIREGYINLMLLRPITQVRVAVGNTVAATNTIIEKTLGGLFSADKKSGLVGQEGYYFAKGMMFSLSEAFGEFGKAFKKLDPAEAMKLDYLPHQIPGILGRVINAPGDAIRGMDAVFKTLTRNGAIYASAMREGVHKGLDGKDLADFVARRRMFPTKAMMEEADQLAKVNTFSNDLGTMASKIRDIAQAGPLVLWFPFMKSPIQLAKYTWNRTPGLQLISKSLYDDIAAGGVRADMAIGRITMANLQGMFLFELAKEGFITGSGPADPALRKAWLATHQPYSIRTPAGWMPIANLEPGSTPLGMMGDFAQIMNQLDEPTAGQAAMAVTFALLHGMADKTWWRTLGDLVDITDGVLKGREPSQEFMRVIQDPAVQVATGGPLGFGIARAVDPIPREARTFLDRVIARVPGYSKELPPKRDIYGDPVLPPQSIGGQWVGLVNPLAIKPYEEDPVKLEGRRLQVKGPVFERHIGGKVSGDFDITQPNPEDRHAVELTNEQWDDWQELYHGLVRHEQFGLQALMNNPQYKKMTRAGQREMFMGLMSDHKSAAREALLVKHPDLAKKLMMNDMKSALPFVPDEMIGQVEQQFKQGITTFENMVPQMRDNLLRYGIFDEEGE